MFHPTQIGDNSAVPSAHSVMRRRIAGTLLFLFLAASTRCASRSTLERPIPPRDSPPLTIRVAVGDDRHIQELHLEEYVRGSVPAEMPLAEPNATVASRLAQLQSILARTYALANQGRHSHEGFDLCSTTHCQVYRSQASQPRAVTQLVANAVDLTTGLIITDGQGPIQALFHADCGGQTSSATAIWGGEAPPYLSGVTDRLCVITPRDDWQLDVGRDQLRQILNTSRDTQVGRRLDRIAVIQRDNAGRATEVALEGATQKRVRGERLRSIISGQLGGRAFRSALFTVEPHSNRFRFKGRGFGHGVGLCQLGAIARARRGHSVEAILAHYYPGTWLAPHAGWPPT